MLKLIKTFLKLRRKKELDRYKRMDSEIRCALAYAAFKEQQKESIKMPICNVVDQRYKDLKITTPKDLIKTYTQFFLEGAVSGVEL